jgi:hypothetical protein
MNLAQILFVTLTLLTSGVIGRLSPSRSSGLANAEALGDFRKSSYDGRVGMLK